jgi:hypothetical protein
MKKKFDINSILFLLGLALPIVSFIMYMVMKSLQLSLSDINGSCTLYYDYGFYCMGCGGTRAFKELLRGHIISSLIYHPIVLYVAVLYLWFMVSFVLEHICNRIRTMRFYPAHGYVAIAIIVLQCLIKNFLIIMWGIHII